MIKQKERCEIEEEYTWDLTKIFKNNDEYIKSLNDVRGEIGKITSFKGKILESSETLLSFLELSDELERKLYKLYYYAHLKLDEDTTNTTSQELEGMITNLLQEYSLLTSFVLPELMQGDYNQVLSFIEQNEELRKYQFNLEDIYRYKSHSLNNDEEKTLSMLSKSLDNASSTFEALTDADIEFVPIIVDGKKTLLTESNYNIYIRSQDRSVRRQAFKRLLTTYGLYKNTLASTFQGQVDCLVSLAKLKKFSSSLEASLFHDNLDTDIYNNLIETINKNMNTIYKYYDLKRHVLGVPKLHLYDVYTPMVKENDRIYTFNDAKNIAFSALKVLGDDYLHNLQKAFDERWIDVYSNKGKRTGAYSSGFYDTNPYLLLNWTDRYEDLTTLVHELGHSMHTYYSCHNNPYNLSSYNIFVAEVASTVNELLLVHYMLEHSDDNDKLFFINQLLELYKSTIYRQVMFAEFERNMHADYEKGVILTNEYLSSKYYELVKKYFGPRVFIDEEIKNEWMRIPHFYYNFYVYKYAVGLSSATKIVNDILSHKEGAVENYLAFLKTGGSMYPKDELEVCGVSVLDEKLYLEAIQTFDKYIDMFSDILKK